MNCMVTPKPPTMSLAHSRTDALKGREGASEYPVVSGVHTPGADGSPH